MLAAVWNPQRHCVILESAVFHGPSEVVDLCHMFNNSRLLHSLWTSSPVPNLLSETVAMPDWCAVQLQKACTSGSQCRCPDMSRALISRLQQPPHFVKIAAGRYHTLAVTAHGQVWTWGFNLCGRQIAPGMLKSGLNTSSFYIPTQVRMVVCWQQFCKRAQICCAALALSALSQTCC